MQDRASQKAAQPFPERGSFFTWNMGRLCLALLLGAALVAAAQAVVASPGLRPALAVVFQGLVLGAAALLCGKLAWGYLRELGYDRRACWAIAGILLLFCCAGLVFLWWYFSSERDIKIYDFSVYWISTLEIRQGMADSIWRYLLLFRETMSHEYTHLLAFPLSLAIQLFGDSFTGYCQSIFVMYYLPACFFLAVLALRLARKAQGRRPGVFAFLAVFSLCALCPVFLWALLMGYTDVGGVLFLALILNYSLDWDGVSFSWRRNLALAGLSVLLLLSRRWYAFYIVGFYAALGTVSFLRMLVERSFTGRRFGLLAANLAAIAGISAAAVAVINPRIFISFLGTNYAEAYSAFKMLGPWTSLWYYMQYVGLAFFLAFVFGLAWFLRNRQTSLLSLRLAGAGVIAAALFLLVQDPGPQHEYLLTPTLLIFLAAFAAFWVGEVGAPARPFVAVGLLSIFAANFAFAYVPAFRGVGDAITPIPTVIRNYPKQLENYDAYRGIYNDLLAKTGGKAASVYIVGEGDVFNPEYFRRINLPDQTDAAAFATISNTVDLRDGFPSQMFPAQYVMFADPFSTLFSTPQQVGYQIYDMLLHDPVMEGYYALDGTYSLASHEAKLYRKIRPMDRAGVDVLKERLRSRYPDNPFVYEPEYFVALMEYDRHMIFYDFWNKALRFYTERGEDMGFHLNDTKTFSSMSFEVESHIPGLEVIIESQDTEIYRARIPDFTRTGITQDIAGSESMTVTLRCLDDSSASSGVVYIYFNAESLAP